jgi:hypothetical protein
MGERWGAKMLVCRSCRPFAELAGQPDAIMDVMALACAQLLGAAHGFEGDRERYDDPNSMLDIVLGRRRGLPILLSVVYIEVARRAGIALAGVGLPGHFVVGNFGADPPLLLDPFAGGRRVEAGVARDLLRPWRAHEIAMRMLNNLVLAYQRRGDLGASIRAASLRLMLGADDPLRNTLLVELRGPDPPDLRAISRTSSRRRRSQAPSAAWCAGAVAPRSSRLLRFASSCCPWTRSSFETSR